MRTHVTVDGITLSRTQVEQALKALNKPEGFKPGDVLVRKNYPLGDRYLVVGADVSRAFAKEWPSLCSPSDMASHINTVCMRTGLATTLPTAYFVKVDA